ncbi:MAG: hypothetical protein ACYTG0_11520 [Planctomycetota bacterium]|jgi:hypothetical protein
MSDVTRREFTGATLAALGSMLPRTAPGHTAPRAKLPTVRLGNHQITRLLVGHNPIKGVSHYTADLSREMRAYFAEDRSRGLELLRRSQRLGINTCQMGAEIIEELLRAHYAEGGTLQWISTFYSMPGKGKEELARILQMRPKPIGIQQLGNTSDRLMKEGKIDLALGSLKRFRDAGVLVGLGSHNHEVIDYVESKGWDLDFYQCCFYRSCFSLNPARRGEIFDEEDRRAMVATIQRVSKPVIAFKVLGANRHCGSPADVERALGFAFQNVKPTDVVLVGMWQKHKDQLAENVGFARKILRSA